MVNSFYILLLMSVLHRFVLPDSSKDAKKRILLNDPDYVQTQLQHFQLEIQELRVKMNTQQNVIADQNTKILALESSATGTQVFYRWGRKDCPGNFSLVYTGYTGGSYYTQSGAAAEYTCMPSDPIWGPNKDVGATNAYMYGAEYQDPVIFQMKDYKEDVPCAVCEAGQVSTVMMIPGRTDCYPGWTEAYHGDLASGAYNHAAATQYICVDQHPQALAGGAQTAEYGKLLYAVKAKCGTLRCPPYEEGKTLSCVVCVK